MQTRQHHNTRSATLSIIGAFVLMAALTFAAKSAQATVAVVHIGTPYHVRTVVYGPAPITSHDGNGVITRGFRMQPYTSGYLACAANEHVIGYDVAALAPFELTSARTAGAMTVYRSLDGASVVLMTATPYKHVAVAANVSHRMVEVEAICER